jgi:hypothetical protein
LRHGAILPILRPASQQKAFREQCKVSKSQSRSKGGATTWGLILVVALVAVVGGGMAALAYMDVSPPQASHEREIPIDRASLRPLGSG